MEIIKLVKNLGEVKKSVEKEMKSFDEPSLLIRRFVSLDGDKACMELDVEIIDSDKYATKVDVFWTDYHESDLVFDPSLMKKELKQLSDYIKKHFAHRCPVEVVEEIEYA